MAKNKKLSTVGTKKELCSRLGIKFYDFEKYSSIFSILGMYEYNAVGIVTGDKRYSGGKAVKITASYENRIAGMMVEKLIAWGSKNVESFSIEKLIKKLDWEGKRVEYSEIKSTDSSIDWEKIKGDIIKIFTKLGVAYTNDDVEFILIFLFNIRVAFSDKEISKLFYITSTAVGGAVSYTHPQIFERIKFEIIAKKDGPIINPFFGVFNSPPWKWGDTNMARTTGYYCQLSMLNLPCLMFRLTSPRYDFNPLLIKDDSKESHLGNFPISYVYLTREKLIARNECDYDYLFLTRDLADFKGMTFQDERNPINLCINNWRFSKSKPLTRKEHLAGVKRIYDKDVDLMSAIENYEIKSNKSFITKKDIRRSTKLTQEYYDTIFSSNYKINDRYNSLFDGKSAKDLFLTRGNGIYLDKTINEAAKFSNNDETTIRKLFDLPDN
uniref:Uncharacterized protein n=1 Tax=Marseillevirus LCMAC102 TaxID=2506603 RepID=A0A481YT65_9VIRU|nr:MAG: hypothetical protein LCMAC102_02070 [Marseillevirus LCMAC102]